jgi:hypothetical protein
VRICVYAIAKNEEQFVERFCESAKDADLIMIADTGSDDHTVAKIGALMMNGYPQLRVPQIFISPWRFDDARNAVLALISHDVDVCVSLDLDEVLQPGWRDEIERVWEVGKTTRLGYMFNWGGPVEFRYEKIHARKGYHWHHPAHEYPMPYGIEEVWAETKKLLVAHKPDSSKSRTQYLKLLKMSVEEDPHCPRNAFYYAREHSFGYDGCDVNIAIKEADRYLALPRAVWPNERAYAYRVKGECYLKLDRPADAEKAYMMATQEAPNTREPWIGLANVCYRHGRWPECYAYALRALSIVTKELVYTTDHDAWGSKPHLLACIGAWNIGLRDVAMAQGKIALALSPEDPLLINNVEVMRKLM